MSNVPSHLPSDAQLLYEYLGRQIVANPAGAPAKAVLADLEEFSLQLEQLRTMVVEAQSSAARGEVSEIQIADILERLRNRIGNSETP